MEMTGSVTDTVRGVADTASHQHTVGLGHSMLSRLPLEIRQQIYGYVLGAEEHYQLGGSSGFNHPLCSTQCTIAYHPNFQRAALLRTCSQVYAEAVDLLYQKSTFIIKSPDGLSAFAATVAPRQLDQIHHIRIEINGERSDDVPLFAYDDMRYWKRFWKTVANISHLRTLRVHLEYGFPLFSQMGCGSFFKPILRPLLGLSGLQEFKLELNIRPIMMPDEVNLYQPDLAPLLRFPRCAQIVALIAEIKEAAVQPRR
ncbi:MAG: hypothetical protein Q9172_003900 [Xanthocarpia lactea]